MYIEAREKNKKLNEEEKKNIKVSIRRERIDNIDCIKLEKKIYTPFRNVFPESL